jgi:cell division protein FtsQ
LSKKKTIQKIAVIGACLLAGGSLVTLLLAANGQKAAHYCRSIDVTIQGGGEKAYISKSDILSSLNRAAKNSIISKRIETINVALLEKVLEQHPWIGDAELYFDTHDVLHVAVSEREPVARVFTTAGNTFYMDSVGKHLPLLPDVNVRVPVITAFSDTKKGNAKDSAVAKDVSAIATYIAHHPFWNAQIAQIDITSSGTFELVPVVGNHIIRIGPAENLKEKLSNLLLFYKQVLSKTGFDNYAVVDVQYKDQVIGSHERTISTVDSVQLQRNIQELMRRAKQQAEADSIAAVEEAAAALDTIQQKPPATVPILEQPQTVPAKSNLPITKRSGKPVKTVKPNNTKNPNQRKPTPKAVMKKRSA